MKYLKITAMSLLMTQSVFAYDITDAINASLKNNIQLQENALDLKRAEIGRFEAASSFLPQVITQSTTSQTISSGDNLKSGSPRQDVISITEEIFSGGKGIYNLKSAKFASEASAVQYQNNVDAIIIQTVQVYEAVIATREMYNVALQNVEYLKNIVKQSEIKLSFGTITKTDMLEAKAGLASAISNKEKAYSEMKNAEDNFKYITGEIAPEKICEIDITSLVLPKSSEVFFEDVETNSPSILLAEKSLQAMIFKTRAAKTMMLPTITASASLGKQNSWSQDPYGLHPPTFQKSKGQTYQLSVTLPIFQRGLEYTTIKKAQLDENEAFLKREDTIQKAQKDASSAWNAYTQSKISVGSDSESVNYYKAFTDGTEEEFKIGTKNLTDLLQAQIKYENARTQLIQDKATMIVSGLRLKFLSGQISRIDFSKLVIKDKSSQEKVNNIHKQENITEKDLKSIKVEKIAEIKS